MKPAYRFSLTAKEIEEILLSVVGKISTDKIVYDYTEGGDVGYVSAASAVRQLWLDVNKMVTGEGLKENINNAGDSNVFTDHYKSILDRENWMFIGSPWDIIVRDDIDTTDFKGGELILLQHNSSGNPEFQYWKKITLENGQVIFRWESIDQSSSNNEQQVIEKAGEVILKKIPKNIFHMVEFRLHGYQEFSGNWHSIDGKLGYKESDLYSAMYNEAKTAELFSYSFDQDEQYMYVKVKTKFDNTKCFISFISGF